MPNDVGLSTNTTKRRRWEVRRRFEKSSAGGGGERPGRWVGIRFVAAGEAEGLSALAVASAGPPPLPTELKRGEVEDEQRSQ